MLGCLAFKKTHVFWQRTTRYQPSNHAPRSKGQRQRSPWTRDPGGTPHGGFPNKPMGKFPTKNWSASWGVEIGGKPTIFKETPIYRDILIWCRYIHNMYYIQWYINICSVSDHRWEICIYTGSVLTPGVHPKAAINEQKRLPSLQHRHTTKSERSDNTM